MLIESPSIYRCLLAFITFVPEKKKPSLHAHRSPLNRCSVKVADCVQLPPRKTRAILSPHHKIISGLHTVDPEG